MAQRLLVLLLAGLPACSLYFGAPPNDHGDQGHGGAGGGDAAAPATTSFELTTVKSIAGEHPVVGIDGDRHGGLWIVYRDPTAHYYDNADVRVVHLDANNAKLSEWLYQDDYAWISGLAFTGSALWINYDAPGKSYLRELDATTGMTLQRFASVGEIDDLTMSGDQLVAARYVNEIMAFDPTTGGMVWTTSVNLYFDTTLRALAAKDNALWIAGTDSNTVYRIRCTDPVLV